MYVETGDPRRHTRDQQPPLKEQPFHVVENLPDLGGSCILPVGTVIELSQPGEKKILTEPMYAVIGAPSTEIIVLRKFNGERVDPKKAQTMSPFQIQRDRRDVIVNNRVVGYVYGPEVYESEKYPND